MPENMPFDFGEMGVRAMARWVGFMFVGPGALGLFCAMLTGHWWLALAGAYLGVVYAWHEAVVAVWDEYVRVGRKIYAVFTD